MIKIIQDIYTYTQRISYGYTYETHGQIKSKYKLEHHKCTITKSLLKLMAYSQQYLKKNVALNMSIKTKKKKLNGRRRSK